MKEELTAGGREFVFALFAAAALYVCCAAIMAAFDKYPFIGAILSVLIFLVFGFLVLTRYTAKFTYTLKGGRLRINRMIGKRNKEVEFECADIIGCAMGGRPAAFPKRPYIMRKSIISNKYSMYITYRGTDGKLSGAVIEPSPALAGKIRRQAEKAARMSKERNDDSAE